MTNRADTRRAWITVAVLSLIMSGTVGLLANTTGLLFNAILADTGFRAGDLSIYYTVRQLSGSAAVILTSHQFRRGRGHYFVALTCVVQAVGIGAFALCTRVWHWYFLALLTSFGQGSMHTVCAITVANWFRRRGGLATGIAMSFSGLTGVLANLLVSRSILALGWRAAVVYMMGVSILVTVPVSLLGLRTAPEELGRRPYGEPAAESAVRQSVTLTPEQQRRARRLCAVFAVGIGVCMSLATQLALLGKSLHCPLTVAAYMQSCSMAGNLGGKLLIGLLSDRLGAFRTMRASILLICCSYLLFLLFPGAPLALYLGSVLLGLAYAVFATQSLVYQEVFGLRNYKSVLTRMMTVCGVVNAAYSMLTGYACDYFGSLRLPYAAAALLCVLQLAALRRLRRAGAAG